MGTQSAVQSRFDLGVLPFRSRTESTVDADALRRRPLSKAIADLRPAYLPRSPASSSLPPQRSLRRAPSTRVPPCLLGTNHSQRLFPAIHSWDALRLSRSSKPQFSSSYRI